jgi:hypothetical protein
MLVKATRMGYYDLKRRYEGDEFVLENEKHFSSQWMEKIEESYEVKAEKPKPKGVPKFSAKRSQDEGVL